MKGYCGFGKRAYCFIGKIVNKELNALRLGSAQDTWPSSHVEAL